MAQLVPKWSAFSPQMCPQNTLQNVSKVAHVKSSSVSKNWLKLSKFKGNFWVRSGKKSGNTGSGVRKSPVRPDPESGRTEVRNPVRIRSGRISKMRVRLRPSTKTWQRNIRGQWLVNIKTGQ